jgi:hypothetical protein
VLHAIERFHATYPDVILELNVSRHPYSFLGDQRSGTGSMAGYDAPLTQTWHDALLGYMGNNPVARDQAERAMAVQGASAGLNLECVHRLPPPIPTSSLPSTALLSHSDAPCRSFGVLAQWQPVESQRLLLWAGRFGLQEEFMSALNKRHFEQRQSASARSTLLDAAREVGLDVAAAVAFLDSRELEDVVWKSYGQTIHEKKIHSVRPSCLPILRAVALPLATCNS